MAAWAVRRIPREKGIDDEEDEDDTLEGAVREYQKWLFERSSVHTASLVPGLRRSLLRTKIAARADALFIHRVTARQNGTSGIFGISHLNELLSTFSPSDITTSEDAAINFGRLFAVFGFVRDGKPYVRDPLAFCEGRIVPFEPTLFIDIVTGNGEAPRVFVYLDSTGSPTERSLVTHTNYQSGQWIWEKCHFSFPNFQEEVRRNRTIMTTGSATIKLVAEKAYTGTHGQVVQPALTPCSDDLKGRTGMFVYVEENGVGYEAVSKPGAGKHARIGVVNNFSAINDAPGIYEMVVKGDVHFEHANSVWAAPPTEIEIECLGATHNPKGHLQMVRKVSSQETAECFLNIGMVEYAKDLVGGQSVTFVHTIM